MLCCIQVNLRLGENFVKTAFWKSDKEISCAFEKEIHREVSHVVSGFFQTHIFWIYKPQIANNTTQFNSTSAVLLSVVSCFVHKQRYSIGVWQIRFYASKQRCFSKNLKQRCFPPAKDFAFHLHSVFYTKALDKYDYHASKEIISQNFVHFLLATQGFAGNLCTYLVIPQ